jgi:GNAT superfamily N-acetyltransferase
MDKIPQGFEVRPIRFADLDKYVDFSNLIKKACSGEQGVTSTSIKNDWLMPGFDLESSTLLVLSEEKEIVASVEVRDERKPPVVIDCVIKEHPQYEYLGLGELLLEWAEERAGQSISRCPEDTQVELMTSVTNEYPRLKQIFEKRGFVWRRRELRMIIHFSEEQKPPQFPERIKIRTYKKDTDSLAVYQADDKAFEDLWGFVKPVNEEEGYRIWKHAMEEDERFDPDFWFLALEDEKVAGVCLCFPCMYSHPEMVYVENLGVLRDFRRRGIAQALMRQTFFAAWQKGKKGVCLHVDSQSLTGAVRLYEGVGMKPDQTLDFHTKILRSGKNLSTENLN